MPPEINEPIDYKQLILRLTAHACRFLNVCQSSESEAVIQGTGMSPADFAINVVGMFATGKLPHDGSKGMGGLIRHLTVAMERDMLDALDRAEHKRAEFLDPVALNDDEPDGDTHSLADIPGRPIDLPEHLDGEAFKARIYDRVEHEPELKEMAVAIFEVNALKPREIASVCLTTPEDIQNRKKRFARLLEADGYKLKKVKPI